MNTNEFLKRTRNAVTLPNGRTIEDIRPRMKLSDGFEVSVQASESHYCSPRDNGIDRYDEVELGFPNAEESLIMNYAEEPDRPLDTVYGYVPVEIVDEMIEKHGGIVNFKEGRPN